MSVVAVSHLALTRARRNLETAFKAGDWEEIRRCDRCLGDQLNRAFSDEHRDARALVQELERVLSLYGRMVKTLPVELAGKLSPL